jgi:hypothetical protein
MTVPPRDRLMMIGRPAAMVAPLSSLKDVGLQWAERTGHHHVGILTVVEAGVRRDGEQFGGKKMRSARHGCIAINVI